MAQVVAVAAVGVGLVSRRTRPIPNYWHEPNPSPAARAELRAALEAGIVRPADPDACWGWSGKLHPTGYPILEACGMTVFAQRAAWRLDRGQIPFGIRLRRLPVCTSRACTRPDHRELRVKGPAPLGRQRPL